MSQDRFNHIVNEIADDLADYIIPETESPETEYTGNTLDDFNESASTPPKVEKRNQVPQKTAVNKEKRTIESPNVLPEFKTATAQYSMTYEEEDDEEELETELIVFQMGSETYAMKITQVREVLALPAVQKIPNAPGFIDGVIEIRGDVLPVLSLEKRFFMQSSGLVTEKRVLVIISNRKKLGIIVDGVSEVLSIDSKAIEKTSEIISGIEARFIEGLVRKNGESIVLLNMDKILSADELEKFNAAANKGLFHMA